jgi:hypothetical protein
MFCRKVNIPFVVYGFGDSSEAKFSDLDIQGDYEKQSNFNRNNPSFVQKDKCLSFACYQLIKKLQKNLSFKFLFRKF